MSRTWNDWEIELLVNGYKKESDVKRFALMFMRTESSIKHKASKLGLKVRNGRAKVRNHHGKPYWYIIKNRKAIMIHDIIGEKMIGRPLTKDEVVHHIDEDSLNNRKSNLQVMTRSAHMLLHSYNRERDSKGQFC